MLNVLTDKETKDEGNITECSHHSQQEIFIVFHKQELNFPVK